MTNLIGISGKIGSGKDTIGKMIQIITNYPEMSTERVLQHLDKDFANSKFKIKRFADKLKDCVCLIIGCIREQLEDRDFKNTPLGPEWNFWRLKLTIRNQTGGQRDENKIFMSMEECHEYYSRDKNEFGGNAGMRMFKDAAFEEVQMTPRLLLQLLGTDCGRRIIHPNIWVNASFADWKSVTEYTRKEKIQNLQNNDVEHEDWDSLEDDYLDIVIKNHGDLPKNFNWIFTDMRFPNELYAIKERGGLTVRVKRPLKVNLGIKGESIHESEIALDTASFDWKIDNNGSLEQLVEQVKMILEHEKIIS